MVSLSKPWRIHLHPGTDTVVTVRLSVNAMMGGLTDTRLGFGASAFRLSRLDQYVHGQGEEYH